MKYEEAIAEAEESFRRERKAGIDGAEKREYVKDDAERGYKTYEELKAEQAKNAALSWEELSKRMGELIRKNRELLGISETEPLGLTVGWLNPETGKCEGGAFTNEELAEKLSQGLTVGYYDPLLKEWVGGEAVKNLHPPEAKPFKPLR